MTAATVYSIAQIIELATGHPASAAQLDGWVKYATMGGSLESIADAFVASTMFAAEYNNGIAVNPDSVISWNVANGIISNALGSAPTWDHVNAWFASGLSAGHVFLDFALGDQFSTTVSSQLSIVQTGDNSYSILPHDPFAEFSAVNADAPIIGVVDSFY